MNQIEATQNTTSEVKVSINPAGSVAKTNKLDYLKPKSKSNNSRAKPQSEGRSFDDSKFSNNNLQSN